LNPELKRILDKIKDESLREKVAQLLQNPTIEIGGKVYSGLSIEEAPAGLSRHHSYPGGFLEHLISTSRIALTLCDIVRTVYGGEVNQDLVIAGTLLHDVFKLLTYKVEEDGTYGVTPLAERMNHLSLAVSEMVRRGFPLDLIHIVCAHHGEAGPISPRTVEALICHLADVTDSRLNGEILRAARHLIKEVTGEEPKQLTSREAFEIVRLKQLRGLEGVKEAAERIMKGKELKA